MGVVIIGIARDTRYLAGVVLFIGTLPCWLICTYCPLRMFGMTRD
jgi:hypothetical protein